MKTLDIAWLAGLIEGEGSFCTRASPVIQLQMVDADVVARAAALFGVKPRNPWRSKLGNRQLVEHFTVCGTRAIGWMMTLYPLMGQRRQAKIRELIASWRASPRAPRAPRGQRFMAFCHPERVRCANGLCDTCYMRVWRAKKKAKAMAVEAT